MDHPRGDRDRLLGMGVLSGLTFLVLCLTPPLRFLVGLVSNFILAGIIGFQLAELMDRKYRKEVRLKHPTVFISGEMSWPRALIVGSLSVHELNGCDSGLGLHTARRLHEHGFEVHAGVLDPGSEGATTLKGMRVHVVPLDYMDEDSIVQAYKTVTTQLGDKGHMSIPGSVGASAAAAALCSLADGLRRELHKWQVNVSTVEPMLYKGTLPDVNASQQVEHTMSSMSAPAVKFVDNVPISIKLPDSNELVKTDVPSQSTIQEKEAAKPVEPETKKEAPVPPAESKPPIPQAPTIPDLSSITDAFTKVRAIDKHPTVLVEVVKILQVIFDFRRVMSDMQQILHGDLAGVLREYPERARGLFHMVRTLPSRFANARDKVEEVKEESQEPEYMQTLNELQSYLTSAGASAEELPNALSLVSTLDALRKQPRSSRVVDEIKDIFTIIPDTFRAYGRRSKLNGGPGIFSPSPVSPLSPWNPLNPLSPISPVSAVSRLTPGDPLRPISRAQVRAVDTVSKRLVDLFNARTGSKKSSCLSGICNLQA
ncbi:hypothetical protein HPB51_026446 [Rhipicephalus microplus]|uniref:Uncharacterized protein n=1 Tax=Rhipicephalus microplus TaxID=6941 RepID=A0A9J6D2X1_RHIMP|nr:hypothetical protein HPB51_026446 [Rhipicephalus microplus]